MTTPCRYPQCLNTKKANTHYLTQAFKFIQSYLWTHRQSRAADVVVSVKGAWRNVANDEIYSIPKL